MFRRPPNVPITNTFFLDTTLFLSPEAELAPDACELETERLRPPVIDRREQAEEHAADDHIMEMRKQEQRVVENEVGGRHREQHPGHPADDEGQHEDRKSTRLNSSH